MFLRQLFDDLHLVVAGLRRCLPDPAAVLAADGFAIEVYEVILLPFDTDVEGLAGHDGGEKALVGNIFTVYHDFDTGAGGCELGAGYGRCIKIGLAGAAALEPVLAWLRLLDLLDLLRLLPDFDLEAALLLLVLLAV